MFFGLYCARASGTSSVASACASHVRGTTVACVPSTGCEWHAAIATPTNVPTQRRLFIRSNIRDQNEPGFTPTTGGGFDAVTTAITATVATTAATPTPPHSHGDLQTSQRCATRTPVTRGS